MLHQDFHFPSFEAPRATTEEFERMKSQRFKDAAIATGTLPYAEKHWRTLKSTLRFHNTNQLDKMEEKLENYWDGSNSEDKLLVNALFTFL